MKLTLTILFLALNVICFAQNKTKKDSLLNIIKEENLSKKELISLFGSIAFYHPHIDSAIYYANQSFKLAIEIGEPILQAESLEEISHLERRLGNNSKSFEASLRAMQIYEREGMEEKVAASYNQLAVNHMMDEDYDLAIQYLSKALLIYKNTSKWEHYSNTLLNLGEAYRLIEDLDKAEISFKEVLELNQKTYSEITQGYALGNLGMVYSAQNNLNLAEEELNAAIKILAKLGDPYSSSVYLAELGEVNRKQGNQFEAKKNLVKAMAIAEEAGLKEQIRDFSVLLTHFYESQHNYPKALAYQKLFQIYQDSLVNKVNIQKIEQLKAGYEIDKKETEIGLLNTINTKQKYLVFMLGAGVLLTLLFIYLLRKGNLKIKKANLRLSIQKETITKKEQEKALLLRELNHRVKNNLQMISSLLNLQSRELTGHPAKEAIISGQLRVEALSLVHRKLYQEGVDTKIHAKEYIEDLVLGLFHGYNAEFQPSFDIDDIDINIDVAIPLALIINELIINSLKYAFMNVSHPKLKLILKKESKNFLQLSIIDNGVGFKTNGAEKKNSFGIKLIHSLVNQMEGTIEKTNNQGTHWKMGLKIAS